MGTSVPGIGEVSVKVILKKKRKLRAKLNDKRIILMCRIHPIICQFEDFMVKQFTKLFMAYLEPVFIVTHGRAN